MKHVSIREAKARLSAILREVEDCERVIITRNGKPVAEVVPYRKKGGVDFEALERWQKERGITRIVGEIPPDFDDPLPEDFLITPLRLPGEPKQP